MCVREVSLGELSDNATEKRQARVAAELPKLLPRFIKAEANILRFPLFALHTKGLRSLDGIECRSTITRNGEAQEFTFRASRNTGTMYPGPLARAAHLAFLSIATERGFPMENPIAWTWGQLCRRMGVSYSGKMVRNLKQSIKSTTALLITSRYALYSKPEAKPIHTHDAALHLYERVAFVGSRLPDGSTPLTPALG